MWTEKEVMRVLVLQLLLSRMDDGRGRKRRCLEPISWHCQTLRRCTVVFVSTKQLNNPVAQRPNVCVGRDLLVTGAPAEAGMHIDQLNT